MSPYMLLVLLVAFNGLTLLIVLVAALYAYKHVLVVQDYLVIAKKYFQLSAVDQKQTRRLVDDVLTKTATPTSDSGTLLPVQLPKPAQPEGGGP